MRISDWSSDVCSSDLRPIHSEETRATVLASMSAVDLVVVFEEDTPLNLITLLAPHILVKGADYTVERVVGARSEERRVGKECVSTCRTRWSRNHSKKKNRIKQKNAVSKKMKAE